MTKTGAWRTFEVRVNTTKCIKCSLCEIYCPEACVHQVISDDLKTLAKFGYKQSEISEISREKGKVIFLPDKNYCKGCGICVHECPRIARTLLEKEYPLKMALEEK
jgi:pyruvate ferredoxin oxidoreductase delta subunit